MSRIATCRACSFYGQGGKSRIAIPHTCGLTYDERKERDERRANLSAVNSDAQETYLKYCEEKELTPTLRFPADNIVSVPNETGQPTEMNAMHLLLKIPYYFMQANSGHELRWKFVANGKHCVFTFHKKEP